MEALFLVPTLPKIGGAFTLKDNLVMKRFSVKELRQWIMETATEAIQGDSFKTGTVFYKTLPGGVSAVISWSEYGDYEYEKTILSNDLIKWTCVVDSPLNSLIILKLH